ncbi:MAG: YceD family protein [Beijerinckiaceae bacterium]
MTRPPDAPPFSYSVIVTDVPPKGLDVMVEADERERAALAADFKLPGISVLKGTFHIGHTSLGLRVTGRVTARVVQTCSISLEPFEADVKEEVSVDFARDRQHTNPDHEGFAADDPPDEIIDGRIDLGALAAEFLALGLDPYPRKPDVDFSFSDVEGEAKLSPFAKLRAASEGKKE